MSEPNYAAACTLYAVAAVCLTVYRTCGVFGGGQCGDCGECGQTGDGDDDTCCVRAATDEEEEGRAVPSLWLAGVLRSVGVVPLVSRVVETTRDLHLHLHSRLHQHVEETDLVLSTLPLVANTTETTENTLTGKLAAEWKCDQAGAACGVPSALGIAAFALEHVQLAAWLLASTKRFVLIFVMQVLALFTLLGLKDVGAYVALALLVVGLLLIKASAKESKTFEWKLAFSAHALCYATRLFIFAVAYDQTYDQNRNTTTAGLSRVVCFVPTILDLTGLVLSESSLTNILGEH